MLRCWVPWLDDAEHWREVQEPLLRRAASGGVDGACRFAELLRKLQPRPRRRRRQQQQQQQQRGRGRGGGNDLDLRGLERFVTGELPRHGVLRQRWWTHTLPHIAALAAELPTLPNLRRLVGGVGGVQQQKLTRAQCASLVAGCFLGLFARRDEHEERPAAAAAAAGGRAAAPPVGLPRFDFLRLFGAPTQPRHAQSNQAKLMCVAWYFERCRLRRLEAPQREAEPLSFVRCGVDCTAARGGGTPADWAASEVPLARAALSVESRTEEGTRIEDAGRTGVAVHADFANRVLGGGVLGNGAVQEEIRMAVSPELLVGLLLADALADGEGCTEVVAMVGAERYSRYSGYAAGFRYAGDFVDPDCDCPGGGGGGDGGGGGSGGGGEVRRAGSTVLALDALNLSSWGGAHPALGRLTPERQWEPAVLARELRKLWAAAKLMDHLDGGGGGAEAQPHGQHRQRAKALFASGNWGCGAFGGHVQLKAVLQMMAMAQAGRPLQLHTFGEASLDALAETFSLCASAGLTVGAAWRAVVGSVGVGAGDGGHSSELPLEHVFRRLQESVAAMPAALPPPIAPPPPAAAGAAAAAAEKTYDEFADGCDDAAMAAALDDFEATQQQSASAEAATADSVDDHMDTTEAS